MRPLTLLALWQLKNTLRTTLTQPRKLIPFLVFAAYVALQLFNAAMVATVHGGAPPGAERLLAGSEGMIASAAFILLVLLALTILDTGFSGGFLAFTLPDVDYLFPSPISRRLVLAYRLLTKTGLSLIQATFLFYFLVWKPLDIIAPDRYSAGDKVAALLATALCIGGYANLAFLCKLIFGFGKRRTVRAWLLGGVALILGAAVYGYWRAGVFGLEKLAGLQALGLLFFPCRLAANSIAGPLLRDDAWTPVPTLGLFYLVTAALLFSRRENFYEASLEGTERFARRLQAAREQNWGAIFGAGSGAAPRARALRDEHPYAVPPFGRGAVALFWAHLAAAAKRPTANFLLPAAAGVGLALFATAYVPHRFSAIVTGGVCAYVMFFLTISGIAVFRQGIQRQPLVRSLPLTNWGAVLADVLPRTLLCSVTPAAAGLTLLPTRAEHAGEVAALLGLYLPAALLGLNLVQYGLALVYPESQDKFQQMLAGFISLFLNGFAAAFLALLLVLPRALHAPPWLSALTFLLPVMAADGALLLLVAWLYRRFEPRR